MKKFIAGFIVICLGSTTWGQGTHEFRVTLGRDGGYPKSVRLGDGIRLKLEDTDRSPLDADFEVQIHYGHHERKFEIEDVGVGQTANFAFRGAGGAPYDLQVLDIDYDCRCVTVGLYRRAAGGPEFMPSLEEAMAFEEIPHEAVPEDETDAEIRELRSEIETLEARLRRLEEIRNTRQRHQALPEKSDIPQSESRQEPVVPDTEPSPTPLSLDRDDPKPAVEGPEWATHQLDSIEQDLAAGAISVDQYDKLIRLEDRLPPAQTARFHVLVGLYAYQFSQEPQPNPYWSQVTTQAFHRARTLSPDFDARSVCRICWTSTLESKWEKALQDE